MTLGTAVFSVFLVMLALRFWSVTLTLIMITIPLLIVGVIAMSIWEEATRLTPQQRRQQRRQEDAKFEQEMNCMNAGNYYGLIGTAAYDDLYNKCHPL
jgi:nitrate/nitrite transporter NarK